MLVSGTPRFILASSSFPVFPRISPRSRGGSSSLRSLSIFLALPGKVGRVCLGFLFVWLHAALKAAYHEGYNLALFGSPCCSLQALLIFLTFFLFRWLCVRATSGLPCALPRRLDLLTSLLWNDRIQSCKTELGLVTQYLQMLFQKDCKTWLQNPARPRVSAAALSTAACKNKLEKSTFLCVLTWLKKIK